MAVDLRKIQRGLDKAYRAEDKALANLQRILDKDTKPAKQIKFTTSLSVGGRSIEISTETVNVNASGRVINTSSTVNHHSTHQHSISWDDIDKAYVRQEEIHERLVEAYRQAGQVYGGRRLYSRYDKNKTKLKNGVKTIDNNGLNLLDGDDEFGYKYRYKAIDVSIHKKVLEDYYKELYVETDKHLLEKFKSIDLDGDFNKLIKGTEELVYDIKKAKNWAKEVEQLVKSAELKYKAQVKELQKAERRRQRYTPDYILTIEQLEQIGRAILGLAIEKCPIETGFLRSSGKLYVSDNDIRIIFECPYAGYVHDNVNMNHPVGEDHFLEKAAQEILPTISVWTEMTGDASFVLGDYMAQTWDRDRMGRAVGLMYWQEQKGYQAVYIDIDRNLKVNYYHYK